MERTRDRQTPVSGAVPGDAEAARREQVAAMEAGPAAFALPASPLRTAGRATCAWVNPATCGKDCSTGTCPNGTVCESINSGKIVLGRQCMPVAPACDLSTRVQVSCTDTWAGWADGFFAVHCRSCHRHMMGYVTADATLLGAAGIRLSVERNAMPPAGEPALSEADQRRLMVWLACDSRQ